ncbi:DUF4276 family protein [Amycolatopsis jiangsuensis]|uniref:DUF4276 family protein n=1 Tax=Amycolatopsis jiangsuensis TaxID=1181879 RepID=UPI0028AEEABD|nr:DUF4276 family protein [Amycolatopsis jiangsuensis]
MVTTRRPASGGTHRGGVSSWGKLETDLRLLLRNTDLHVLTTLFDYYAFPANAPGMGSRPDGGVRRQVEHVEAALATAIGDSRFVPHLMLHELETWVFAAAEQLGELMGSESLTRQLQADALAAGGVELVNDSPATAPSKRLTKYCDRHSKTTDGPLAISELGIAELRAQCPHLDGWLAELDRRARQLG